MKGHKEDQIERGQLDSLWAYVGNKGEKGYPETVESGQFWRAKLIDMDTRLRVARGIAKAETEASQQVFETLKQRRATDAPPPLVSDGWGGIDEAIIEVYGRLLHTQASDNHRPESVPGRVGNICKWSNGARTAESSERHCA